MIFEDRILRNPRLLRLKNPTTQEVIDWEIQDLEQDEILQEGTEVTATILNQIQTDFDDTKLNKTVVTDVYSSSQTYAVGDYCIKDNTLYKCTTAISTAEAWNSAHWTATTIATELNSRLEFEVVESW